ncbi:hypothetical protein HDV05_002250 [Chytridiales sp. JEL 0842]|nr:hypothetical protein HDV05_002250 [Chytridiales sp. JEL 0842]
MPLFKPSPSTYLRALTFLTSSLCLLTAGSLFAFSSYSESLRTRFDLSAISMNWISGMGVMALYLSFGVVGPVWDRWGVRVVMCLATVTFSAGYLLTYVAFLNPDTFLGSPAALAFFHFLAGFGSCASFMASYGISALNLPPRLSGLISGVLGVFYGLSGSLFAQINRTWFGQDPAGFLLFCGVSVGVVNGLGMIGGMQKVPWLAEEGAMRDEGVKTREEDPDKTEMLLPEGGEELMGILKSAPLEESEKVQMPSDFQIEDSESSKTESIKEVEATEPQRKTRTMTGRDMTPLQIVKSFTFWLYTLTYVWQQGYTYFNNIGTILSTLPQTTNLTESTSLHVTILSVAQCLGRLSFGILADLVLQHTSTDRSFLLIIAEVLVGIPMLLVSVLPALSESWLIFCSILIGFSFGATSSIFPPLTRDFFGMKHYGTAMGFVLLLNPLGILLSNLIFGGMFDSKKAGGCVGEECFQGSFAVFAGLQCLSIGLSVGLFWRRAGKGRRQNAKRELKMEGGAH